MLARLLLVALAAVAAVVAVQQLHHDHRCTTLLGDIATGRAARLTSLAHVTTARCGDTQDRATAIVTLLSRRQRQLAIDVARDMTRSTPDEYVGWLALWRLTRSQEALARAHELNPRGTPAPS